MNDFKDAAGEPLVLKPVSVCAETHERIRTLAFEKRISLRTVIEEALAAHYQWPVPEGLGRGTKGLPRP